MKKISNNIRVINAGSANGSVAVIDVLGDISQSWWTDGGFTKEAILNDLKSRKIEEVHFNISSLGGDYGEALAIKNMAVRTGAKIKVHYFGMVASAATEIGNAASRSNTTASSDFFMLIHNTSTWAGGNKEAILKTYDSLAKFDDGLARNYAAKSGARTASEFAAKMTEDVWMNAAEALEWGLIGGVTEAQPISAHALKEIESSMSKLKIKAPKAKENNLINPNPKDVTEKTAKKLFNKVVALFENAGLKITTYDKSAKVEDLVHDITTQFRIAASGILDEEQSENEEGKGADYSISCTESVTSIELKDGTSLELADSPYDLSSAGADLLQTDLSELLDADSVSVTFSEEEQALIINIYRCKQILETVNGSIQFTSYNAAQYTPSEVSNLEKQLIQESKKLKVMRNSGTDKKVKELKAELQRINNQINSIAAAKTGGKSLGSKPVSIGNTANDEENGASFLSGVIKNYHSHNQ